MDPAAQVETILSRLRKLGLSIRYEHLGGTGGGLCRIRGDRVMFIDLDADIATTADRCVEALASLPDADSE